MQVTREDLNPCTIQLTISCDPEQVQNGITKTFKDLAKRIRVPGFRPGTAPRAVLEKMVSQEEVNEMALDNIVRSAFRAALKEQELQPYSQPSVELKEMKPEEGVCEFVAKVPLEPQVQLGEYKDLPVEVPKLEVEEDEVEAQIEELRKRRSTREVVKNRGVLEGDVAVVNVSIEGEADEGRTFMAIAGKTFPDLDQALLGMKAEEMKSAELSFPEGFQEADWAGQKHKVKITLRSLSAVKLPELDESFAQEFSTESVEELREKVRNVLVGAKVAMRDEYVVEQIMDALLKSSEIHVPDTMWEQVTRQRLREIAMEQREEGKSLEEYAKEQGMTAETLEEELRREAQTFVKRAVAIQRIFKDEQMKLTQHDLSTELIAMARELEIEPDELLKQLKASNSIEDVHHRAINRKVSEFLRESAKIVEVGG